MSAAEIVKPQLGEAELAGSPDKLFRDAARVSRAREVERLLTYGRRRKYQSAIGQFHEREINPLAVRNTGDNAQMLFALGTEQLRETIINLNRAGAAACLRFLEGDTVRLRFFQRAPDRQRLVGNVQIGPS